MSLPTLSRRRALQLLGLGSLSVVGAGALTSCSPGKATTSPTSAGVTNGAGGAKGTLKIAYSFLAPPSGTFNIYSPQAIIDTASIFVGDLLHMPSAYFMWADKSWVKYLVEDFGLDEAAGTYTIKLKQGLKWSDGSALTAKDYVASFHCNWLLSQPVWSYIKSVKAADDHTVVLTLNQPSTVLERYILKMKVADHATYGEIADQVAPLIEKGAKASDPEATALLTKLQELKPTNPLSSGPYKFDTTTITNTQLTLVLNPEGYAADTVKFETVICASGETTDVTPLVQSKGVDYAGNAFPPNTEKALIAAGIRIIRPPNMSGPALYLNLDAVPEFKDKRVRQAFAMVMDRDRIGQSALAASGKAVTYMAGFSDNALDEWLPSGVKEKLKQYPLDATAAAGLLTEAGWTKDGDSWKTPAGKKASYELSFPAEYADWSAAGKSAAQMLTEFGIAITPRGVNFNQAPLDIDKGNFQLAIQSWGSSGHPHPYFSFLTDLFTHNIPIAKNNGGRGSGFELDAVPGPDGKPVNLEQLVTACGAGLDLDKQKEQIGTIAQIFNEQLPIIPLFERYGNNACLEGLRVKKYPEDSDPILKNPQYADNFMIMSVLNGKLEPVD